MGDPLLEAEEGAFIVAALLLLSPSSSVSLSSSSSSSSVLLDVEVDDIACEVNVDLLAL